MNDVTRTSKEWNTPWLAEGFALYDTKGALVAHTGITGTRTYNTEQLERMAKMIADAVNAYSAGEPRARDADLYEWVSGLIEALNLAGITRAEGDEHIDTDYLAELHSRLAQPPLLVSTGRCPRHGDYLGEFCTASTPGQPMCFYSSKLGRRTIPTKSGEQS